MAIPWLIPSATNDCSSSHQAYPVGLGSFFARSSLPVASAHTFRTGVPASPQ